MRSDVMNPATANDDADAAPPVTRTVNGTGSSSDGSSEVSAAASDRVRRPLALSPSRANDFKQCPLLYRFRAIDRLPEAPSRAQVRGTVVHATLEALYELPAAQRQRGTATSLIQPVWEQACAETPELAELIGDERSTFFGEVEQLVQRYFEMEDPTRFDPESCELLVEAQTEDGVALRGFVDRIDVAPTGEVRVVDYKTGRSPSEMSTGQALFQMKFYALVIYRVRGVVPTQLKLIYLGDGRTLTYAPEAGELLRFERTLSAIWSAIRAAGDSGDFRPSPGRLCDWCDHKSHCPSFGGTPPAYPGWPEAVTA
nr:RecB family exonuclease [Hoyosella subflava]